MLGGQSKLINILLVQRNVGAINGRHEGSGNENNKSDVIHIPCRTIWSEQSTEQGKVQFYLIYDVESIFRIASKKRSVIKSYVATVIRYTLCVSESRSFIWAQISLSFSLHISILWLEQCINGIILDMVTFDTFSKKNQWVTLNPPYDILWPRMGLLDL